MNRNVNNARKWAWDGIIKILFPRGYFGWGVILKVH